MYNLFNIIIQTFIAETVDKLVLMIIVHITEGKRDEGGRKEEEKRKSSQNINSITFKCNYIMWCLSH